MELLWTNHITPQSLNRPIHTMETKTHAFQTKCFKVCKEKSLYSIHVPHSFSTDSCTILAFSKFLQKKIKNHAFFNITSSMLAYHFQGFIVWNVNAKDKLLFDVQYCAFQVIYVLNILLSTLMTHWEEFGEFFHIQLTNLLVC